MKGKGSESRHVPLGLRGQVAELWKVSRKVSPKYDGL